MVATLKNKKLLEINSNKKIRILEVTPFDPFDKAYEQIKKGKDFPLHHIWCYDTLMDHGYEVIFIDFDRDSLLNRIGKRLWIENLQQQVNCLKRSKDYDLVFDPFMQFTFLLAFLRLLRIFNKPIIAISQRAHAQKKKNWVKRLKHRMVRYIYYKGIDQILFLNKTLFDESNRHPIAGNSTYLRSWGADVEFFQSFTDRQKKPPSGDYFLCAGASARDYTTLIRAFHEIDFNLKISAKTNSIDHLNVELSPNILIDKSKRPKAGMFSTDLLRLDYYNAYAVVICLAEVAAFGPFGVTILMEAMAMGKPVITTRNQAYPFDVEKEKVGFNVDYGDVEGWRRAVNYLLDHPDEAREMGERGLALCKTHYNYVLFSEEILRNVSEFIEKEYR